MTAPAQPVRIVLLEGGPAIVLVPDPRCTWCGSADHAAATCSDRKRRGGR